MLAEARKRGSRSDDSDCGENGRFPTSQWGGLERPAPALKFHQLSQSGWKLHRCRRWSTDAAVACILAPSPHQRARPPPSPSSSSSSFLPQARGYFYLPQNANEAPIPRLSQRQKIQILDGRFPPISMINSQYRTKNVSRSCSIFNLHLCILALKYIKQGGKKDVFNTCNIKIEGSERLQA